jgi:hypothetical protein
MTDSSNKRNRSSQISFEPGVGLYARHLRCGDNVPPVSLVPLRFRCKSTQRAFATGVSKRSYWFNLSSVTHFQTLFYILGQFAPNTANDRGYRLKFGGFNRRVVNNVSAAHPSGEVNLDSLVADS